MCLVFISGLVRSERNGNGTVGDTYERLALETKASCNYSFRRKRCTSVLVFRGYQAQPNERQVTIIAGSSHPR